MVKPVHRDDREAHEVDENLVSQLLAHQVEGGSAEPTLRGDFDPENEQSHDYRKNRITERDGSVHWEEARKGIEFHVGQSRED